jgi:hypothetical protein
MTLPHPISREPLRLEAPLSGDIQELADRCQSAL